MEDGSIVKVKWESGINDDDLYQIVGRAFGKIIVKSLSVTNAIQHHVWPSQIRSA